MFIVAPFDFDFLGACRLILYFTLKMHFLLSVGHYLFNHFLFDFIVTYICYVTKPILIRQ
jgi:hypothetical protein